MHLYFNTCIKNKGMYDCLTDQRSEKTYNYYFRVFLNPNYWRFSFLYLSRTRLLSKTKTKFKMDAIDSLALSTIQQLMIKSFKDWHLVFITLEKILFDLLGDCSVTSSDVKKKKLLMTLTAKCTSLVKCQNKNVSTNTKLFSLKARTGQNSLLR